MEVAAGIVTVTGLIGGVTKIASAINNLKEKWHYAPLNLTMVSSSLLTVRAALQQIALWRAASQDKSEESEQLDKDLEVCLESCAVMVAMVENRLKDVDLDNITMLDRARFVALDQLFKDLNMNLGAQVQALQLLLTIFQCRSLPEQREQLQRQRTREVVRAVHRSAASMAYEDRDIEDAASILSETPSQSFAFDKIIMQHPSYSRTYPRLFEHMQASFPSRRASVASTVKPSPRAMKPRSIPVKDAVIPQHGYLPFLGVPFAGEKRLDIVEEDSKLDSLRIKADSTRNAISGEVERKRTTSTDQIHKPADITPRVSQHSSSAVDEDANLESNSESTPSMSMEATNDQNDTSSPAIDAKTTISPRQSTRDFKQRRRKPSFDSLYDVSGDESQLSTEERHNAANRETRDNLQENGGLSRTSSSPPEETDQRSNGSISKENIKHDKIENPVMDSSADGESRHLSETVESPLHQDSEPEPNRLRHTHQTCLQTIMDEAVARTTASDSANKPRDTTTPTATDQCIPNFLDFEFDPFPDINLQVSMFDTSLNSRVQTTTDPEQISSLASNEEISGKQSKPEIATNTNEADAELSQSMKDESSASLALDENQNLKAPVEPEQAIDTSDIKPTFVGSEASRDLSDLQQPIDLPPDHPPPPPPIATLPETLNLNVDSSEPNPVYIQEPTPTASGYLPSLPPRRSRSSLNQPNYSTNKSINLHSNDDPRSNSVIPQNTVHNDSGGRNSIQSELSNNLYPPASPTSFRSQLAASSITSASSSFDTHDQGTYYTSGTTIMSTPIPSVPQKPKSPVQNDQARSVLNSLANHAQRAKPSTPRLSGLSSLLMGKPSEKTIKLRELANAVESNDIANLTSLAESFEKRTDISTPIAIGTETRQRSALMRAAATNHLECVQALLICDPSGAALVDKPGGKTALHYALEKHSHETALWLVNQFCKVVDGHLLYKGKDGQKVYAMPDDRGVHPIHLAAQLTNHSVLEILDNQANADFTVTDSEGKNALHYAAAGKSFDNVRYLVRHGLADVNRRADKGETALMLAAGSGDIHSLIFLIEHGAQKDTIDRAGNKAIHYASRNGHLAIVETLYQSIEDVTAKNNIGEQPLHLAAAGNHTEVLTALLHVPGIDVNAWTKPPHIKHLPDRSGGLVDTMKLACTALHYACAAGQHEAADILIAKGALLNNQVDGYSPLMMACQAQNTAVLSLLLLHGADPQGATAKENLTALHVACRVDSLACAKMLIEHGADTLARLKNKHKDTASSLGLRLNQDDAKAAANYTMRIRAQVIRATTAPTTPYTPRTHGPNVQQTYNPWATVPSQYPPVGAPYPYQTYLPMQNNEPPPPYQR